MGGIELARGEHAFGIAALDFRRFNCVGKVAGHEWFEGQARLNRGQDSVAIIPCGRNRYDRWAEIGHDNGPRKLSGRMIDNRGEHGAITQVNMPVVWSPEGQAAPCARIWVGLCHRTV